MLSEIHVSGLTGRVALVTGAAGGIGRAITTTLLAQGARVAAADLEPPSVDGAMPVTMDVSDEAAVNAAFDVVERELGGVQVVVLNAGIFVIEEFEKTSLDSWRRTLDVNLTGAFLCARRALPGMRASGWGRVIAIGSSAGKTGGSKAMAAYAASKAGVMALAKSIASEYAPSGVTANALAPSLIDTPMIAGIADIASRIPVGRLGQPRDVADLVAFLASDHAGYITGEVVDVNGGFLID
jgi:NAD(P)-dependent dehydrogenase (short-subunit alcohol dehydrogenase family)